MELSLKTSQKEVSDQGLKIEHLESVQSEAWLKQAGTEELLKEEKSRKDGLIIKLKEAKKELTDQDSSFNAQVSKFNDVFKSERAAMTATKKKLDEREVDLEQVKSNLTATETKLEEREAALEQVKSSLTATKTKMFHFSGPVRAFFSNVYF